MHKAGKAFWYAGMTFGGDLYRLVNCEKCVRNVAIQSVGICQISQNARFIFQTSLPRSSEAESIGQIFDG